MLICNKYDVLIFFYNSLQIISMTYNTEFVTYITSQTWKWMPIVHTQWCVHNYSWNQHQHILMRQQRQAESEGAGTARDCAHACLSSTRGSWQTYLCDSCPQQAIACSLQSGQQHAGNKSCTLPKTTASRPDPAPPAHSLWPTVRRWNQAPKLERQHKMIQTLQNHLLKRSETAPEILRNKKSPTNFRLLMESNQGRQGAVPRRCLQRQRKTTSNKQIQHLISSKPISSADLAGRGKYSHETYEDKVEIWNRFQMNSLFWTDPTVLQTPPQGPGYRFLCAPTPRYTAFSHCGDKHPALSQTPCDSYLSIHCA